MPLPHESWLEKPLLLRRLEASFLRAIPQVLSPSCKGLGKFHLTDKWN